MRKTNSISTRWLTMLALLICALVIILSTPSFRVSAQDVTFTQTGTGFYYPLGKSSWSKTGGTWLGRDAKNDTDGPPAYPDGLYHLGVDMPATPGDPVYPIFNGTVLHKADAASDWGTGNIALAIKHTLADGSEFLAIYAHIKNASVQVGDRVSGGVKFAEVGAYPPGGNHLHFSVLTSLARPTNWGRASNSEWPGKFGHVDPVDWITTRTPKCGDATSERYRPNGQVPTHPNGTIIKTASSGTIYVLYEGKRRGIPTPQRLYELYGPGRGFDFRDVITISQEEMNKYTDGEVVSGPLTNNNPHEPDGRIIKQRGGAEISIVTNHGKRRPFATGIAFMGLGYLMCNVAIVDDYNSYPADPPL
jgi:hypothetical protein